MRYFSYVKNGHKNLTDVEVETHIKIWPSSATAGALQQWLNPHPLPALSKLSPFVPHSLTCYVHINPTGGKPSGRDVSRLTLLKPRFVSVVYVTPLPSTTGKDSSCNQGSIAGQACFTLVVPRPSTKTTFIKLLSWMDKERTGWNTHSNGRERNISRLMCYTHKDSCWAWNPLRAGWWLSWSFKLF